MTADRKEITIRSLPEDLNHLEKFIEEICTRHNINNTYFGNITVALSEAVQNAFIHGNREDSAREIRVSFRQADSGLSFTVKDQGEGFRFNEVPDPTANGNEEVVFPGRGIFLIKTLADQVTYKGVGNEVEILFKISSINFETLVDRKSVV